MASYSSSEFDESSGIAKFFHYMVFPVDIFYSGDEHSIADREQRFYELTPILAWLIPLILILTSFTYLSGLGLALYILIQAGIITFLSIIYCWRLSIGFIITMFFNVICSFIILYILLSAVMFIFASCGIIMFIVLVVGIIIFFSRGNSNYYYDDDW